MTLVLTGTSGALGSPERSAIDFPTFERASARSRSTIQVRSPSVPLISRVSHAVPLRPQTRMPHGLNCVRECADD